MKDKFTGYYLTFVFVYSLLFILKLGSLLTDGGGTFSWGPWANFFIYLQIIFLLLSIIYLVYSLIKELGKKYYLLPILSIITSVFGGLMLLISVIIIGMGIFPVIMLLYNLFLMGYSIYLSKSENKISNQVEVRDSK
ncbi:hypothetical protein GW931_02630 [archaeon]|nr:hypothetical protein [archaeon]